MALGMRRAVFRFVAATALRVSRTEVGSNCRWCSSASVGAPTEAQQAALFEHYALGLREILAQTDDLAHPLVVDRVRALRESAPVVLQRPFWGAQFLAMAFGHELGFASAHPPALKTIFDLASASAEAGLVPFHSVRAAHGQLKRLGLLSCELVDPPQERDGWKDQSRGNSPLTTTSDQRQEGFDDETHTAWSLFASARVRAKVVVLCDQLASNGVGVVDDVLGPSLARAVSETLTTHVAAVKRNGAFVKGQLDGTGRSNAGARGDYVTWLSGDEGLYTREGGTGGSGSNTLYDDTKGSTLGSSTSSTSTTSRRTSNPSLSAGAVAQWMRSCLGEYLIESLPPNTLAPSDAYVTNAMLSVYTPGAPGFVPHTDCFGTDDLRRVTAVYYPNQTWAEGCETDCENENAYGGELVLRPNDLAKRRVVAPKGDRLVAFWSDEVEHEVLGVKKNARAERLAVSFWFLKPSP
jgi:hypothetical protein